MREVGFFNVCDRWLRKEFLIKAVIHCVGIDVDYWDHCDIMKEGVLFNNLRTVEFGRRVLW